MSDTAMVPRKSDGRPAARRPLVDDELADQLLGKAQAEGVELLGPDGLLSQVTKAVLERALAEEMTGHLGYDKHDPAGRGSGNNRNGTTGKTLLTDVGAVDLAVPRDRNGTFEPQIVRKGQTRLDGFNERIIALYARGMTTCDIHAHLREIYEVEVSADLICRVTDAVLEELQEWQGRPLGHVYPVIFIDALMVKIRDGVAHPARSRGIHQGVPGNAQGRAPGYQRRGDTNGRPEVFIRQATPEAKAYVADHPPGRPALLPRPRHPHPLQRPAHAPPPLSRAGHGLSAGRRREPDPGHAGPRGRLAGATPIKGRRADHRRIPSLACP